jgi:hypothetical protein
LELSEAEGKQPVVIELKVAKEDLGKTIGKQDLWFCNKWLDNRGHLWNRGGGIPPRHPL